MSQPIRIISQGRMQQYRYISLAAGSTAEGSADPSPQARNMFLFDVMKHDGAQFRMAFSCDAGVGVGFQIDVLFYDAELDAWTEDREQRITASAPGVYEADVLTRRRPVYLRVTAIQGTNAVLDIKGAVFMCSKV